MVVQSRQLMERRYPTVFQFLFQPRADAGDLFQVIDGHAPEAIRDAFAAHAEIAGERQLIVEQGEELRLKELEVV